MRNAVIVGIDGYSTAPLHGCVNDAKEVSKTLALEQYDFDCRVILDSQATSGNIMQALGELSYDGDGGESLLFYFAGHGTVLGSAGYIVTSDYAPYDPGISLAELAQLMEAASRKYEHVITVLDCCHSGGAYNWIGSRPLSNSDIESQIPSVNESRCVLAACRPEESAEERDGHGIYTQQLIEGMTGKAVNFHGEVTLLGLHDYVSRVVAPIIQTPVFKGDIAGTVVLGSGFEAPKGPPVTEPERTKTHAKAHALVDKYTQMQSRLLLDRNYRLNGGSKECALELEAVSKWFEETSAALPDLERDQAWRELNVKVREFKRNLCDFAVGEDTRFGKVLRLMGHGGYGYVWEVKAESGEMHAYKVFHGNELDDKVKVQRFKNGFANMRKLDHPRVVKVKELTAAPFGLVMEAISGENLKGAYLPPDDVELKIRLLLEIAETVQHAHSNDVRHRDIKPENIIIGYDAEGSPVPYLTDFDLAYHETNRTVTTNLGVGGVISYAAPEQLYEPNAVASREKTVDVFSLAQLMFFIIVGRDPSGEDFSRNRENLVKALEGSVVDRAASRLVELYDAATRKNPGDRPQSILEVMKKLSEASSYIQAASGTDKISEDEICRRIAYLYAGLENFSGSDSHARMSSLSGQLEINIRLRSATEDKCSLEFEFSVTSNIPISALKSGKSARTSINSRLDKLIRRFPNTERRPGSKGAYQVYIYANNIDLSVTGVSHAHEIITTCISGIEQW
jgi:serine/threonine protein kinase